MNVTRCYLSIKLSFAGTIKVCRSFRAMTELQILRPLFLRTKPPIFEENHQNFVRFMHAVINGDIKPWIDKHIQDNSTLACSRQLILKCPGSVKGGGVYSRCEPPSGDFSKRMGESFPFDGTTYQCFSKPNRRGGNGHTSYLCRRADSSESKYLWCCTESEKDCNCDAREGSVRGGAWCLEIHDPRSQKLESEQTGGKNEKSPEKGKSPEVVYNDYIIATPAPQPGPQTRFQPANGLFKRVDEHSKSMAAFKLQSQEMDELGLLFKATKWTSKEWDEDLSMDYFLKVTSDIPVVLLRAKHEDRTVFLVDCSVSGETKPKFEPISKGNCVCSSSLHVGGVKVTSVLVCVFFVLKR